MSVCYLRPAEIEGLSEYSRISCNRLTYGDHLILIRPDVLCDGWFGSLEAGLHFEPCSLFKGHPVYGCTVTRVCVFASFSECFQILVILIKDRLLVSVGNFLRDGIKNMRTIRW